MDDLKILISSLSEADKKYFRQYAALQNENANYLKLFNYIDQQKTYTDEAAKIYFKNEAFVKQLSVAKNYLNEVILRTFRISAEKESDEISLQLMMLDIRFLLSKKCLQQLKKVLKRAKKIAEEQENFLVLLNIFSMQRHLLTEFKFEAKENITLDSIVKEEFIVLQKIEHVNTIYHLYCKAKLIITSTRKTNGDKKLLKEFDNIFEHTMLQSPDTATSLRAKHWYWSALHFKHVFEAEPEKDLQNSLLHLKLFEENIQFASTRPLSYMTVLNNVLEAYRSKGNVLKAAPYLKILESVVPRNERESDGKNIYLSHHKMWWYISNNEMEKAISEAIKEFDRINTVNKLKKDSIIVQYTMIAIVLITGKKYKEAAKAVNILLAIPKSGIREDILEHIKIMQLILQAEENQYDIVANILRSIQRSAKQFPLMEIVHQFYKQLLKNPTAKHKRELGVAFTKEIHQRNIQAPQEFPEFLNMLLILWNR